MKTVIYTAALLAFLVAILKPKIEEFGIFRNVANFNNERCKAIKDLETCEDIFVDHPTGIGYLACGNRKNRANWLPALDRLNSEKLPGRSVDYIAILDLRTHEYRKLNLIDLPSSLLKDGVHLHALDLFIHPNDQSSQGTSSRKATLYFINHRVSTDGRNHYSMGADSVVEVFDTFIGSDEATYRKTIKHDLILTPNNLVGMSENSFYVTNDHAAKTHWTRDLEILYVHSEFDSVVYCSFEGTGLECIPALRGRYPFPNGIAKGPNNLLYMANSFNAHLRLLEIQPDNTLCLKDEIKVSRALDNIHVTKSGSVLLATIPCVLKFMNLFGDFENNTYGLVSPSEVWKISNETRIGAGGTQKFRLEKVFGDDGNQVSGTTSVAVWGSKLFLTGIGSPHVSVCEIQEEILA